MKKCKTYCLISPEYPPETGWGGIGTHTWHMAHLLQKEGVEVTVFSYSSSHDQNDVIDNIRVVRKKMKRFNLFLWYISVTIFLIKNRFDVIEDAEFLGSTIIYQLFFKRKSDFVHVKLHTCHRIINYYENKLDIFNRIKTFALNIIEKIVVKRAELITATTNTIKQMTGVLWQIEEKRIKVVPYAFQISVEVSSLRKIPERYLLYFGRLQERKFAKLLLHFIERDILADNDIGFILIGSDRFGFSERLASINNQTIKKVTLLDHIDKREELFSYIASAEAVFLPSKFESFGLTTLESLWFNPNTFVLNNSGPLEIMMSLGLNDRLLEETDLEHNPFSLLMKIKSCKKLGIREIRESITNRYGYSTIYARLVCEIERASA